MSHYGERGSGDQWGQGAPAPPGQQPAGYPPPGPPAGGYQLPYGAPPPPPGQPQRSVGSGCLKALVITIVAFFGLMMFGGIALYLATGDDEDAGRDPSGTAADTGGGQEVFAVGQTARSGDLDVTVHAVRDPYETTNELGAAEPGHRLVAVEAELRNGTDRLITWSVLMGAELIDSQGRPWQPTVTGDTLPQLDGDVPIGGVRRGWIVFQVGQDATGLQLRIKGNPTATGSLFRLS